MRTSPCNECPFRKKSLPGWLGPHHDAREIIQIIDIGMKFPCHVDANAIHNKILDTHRGSITYREAFDQAASKASHCAGALIFMNNTCRVSRSRPIAHMQDAVDEDPGIFRNAAEMQQHHSRFKKE